MEKNVKLSDLVIDSYYKDLYSQEGLGCLRSVEIVQVPIYCNAIVG